MRPLERIHFDWEGHRRTVLLALPEGEGNFPLVFALHGTGGSPRLMADLTGLPRLAQHAPFILALPAALGEQGLADFSKGAAWNAGPGFGCPDFMDSDDRGFLLALLDHLLATLPVDPARIYACGFSNGGRMVYRLLFEASDRFAAFAVIASAPGLPIPDHLPPRGLVIIHGTEDPYVLYHGGVGLPGHQLPSPPVETTMRRLATVMGASSAFHRHTLGPHVCCSTSRGAAEVALWTVQDQGHAWPGGRAWSSEATPTATDLPASELIWDFFRSHTLP
jgi:polyhydroxybutyrate depolymerase